MRRNTSKTYCLSEIVVYIGNAAEEVHFRGVVFSIGKNDNHVEDQHPLKIHGPLIALTNAQIIQRGLVLGVNYGLTLSCYDPSPTGEACGLCDACLLRLRGFSEAGLQDPVSYQTGEMAKP